MNVIAGVIPITRLQICPELRIGQSEGGMLRPGISITRAEDSPCPHPPPLVVTNTWHVTTLSRIILVMRVTRRGMRTSQSMWPGADAADLCTLSTDKIEWCLKAPQRGRMSAPASGGSLTSWRRRRRSLTRRRRLSCLLMTALRASLTSEE